MQILVSFGNSITFSVLMLVLKVLNSGGPTYMKVRIFRTIRMIKYISDKKEKKKKENI